MSTILNDKGEPIDAGNAAGIVIRLRKQLRTVEAERDALRKGLVRIIGYTVDPVIDDIALAALNSGEGE